jgi:two-component system KDP operon response regulator KdpE
VTDRPLRILIVEDDPLNRTLARAVLARAAEPRIRDAVLIDAGSLAEARAALDASTIDLVLLDIHLPDGLGLDLARELHSHPDGARPAVLARTASVLPAEQQATIDAGCDAFLAKPYAPAALVASVESLVVRAVLGG